MSKYPEIDAVLAGDLEGCIVCCDCLSVMDFYGDNRFGAAITDPPYGINEAAGKNKSRTKLAVAKDYGNESWDIRRPVKEIFVEMLRVSKEQVIFGGNYFADMLPPSSSWIVWDKDNGKCDFADCELAWTSHKRAIRKIKWRWQGMLQEPGHPKDIRQHPTQKPLGMMLWIIEHYTEIAGGVVLDPFCGSGTTLVACKKLGRRYVGIDISEKYCGISTNRLRDTEKPLFP